MVACIHNYFRGGMHIANLLLNWAFQGKKTCYASLPKSMHEAKRKEDTFLLEGEGGGGALLGVSFVAIWVTGPLLGLPAGTKLALFAPYLIPLW